MKGNLKFDFSFNFFWCLFCYSVFIWWCRWFVISCPRNSFQGLRCLQLAYFPITNSFGLRWNLQHVKVEHPSQNNVTSKIEFIFFNANLLQMKCDLLIWSFCRFINYYMRLGLEVNLRTLYKSIRSSNIALT